MFDESPEEVLSLPVSTTVTVPLPAHTSNQRLPSEVGVKATRTAAPSTEIVATMRGDPFINHPMSRNNVVGDLNVGGQRRKDFSFVEQMMAIMTGDAVRIEHCDSSRGFAARQPEQPYGSSLQRGVSVPAGTDSSLLSRSKNGVRSLRDTEGPVVVVTQTRDQIGRNRDSSHNLNGTQAVTRASGHNERDHQQPAEPQEQSHQLRDKRPREHSHGTIWHEGVSCGSNLNPSNRLEASWSKEVSSSSAITGRCSEGPAGTEQSHSTPPRLKDATGSPLRPTQLHGGSSTSQVQSLDDPRTRKSSARASGSGKQATGKEKEVEEEVLREHHHRRSGGMAPATARRGASERMDLAAIAASSERRRRAVVAELLRLARLHEMEEQNETQAEDDTLASYHLSDLPPPSPPPPPYPPPPPPPYQLRRRHDACHAGLPLPCGNQQLLLPAAAAAEARESDARPPLPAAAYAMSGAVRLAVESAARQQLHQQLSSSRPASSTALPFPHPPIPSPSSPSPPALPPSGRPSSQLMHTVPSAVAAMMQEASMQLPRSLPPAVESVREMGVAVRPLSLMEVKGLTLALAEAVTAGAMERIIVLLNELEAASCPTGSLPQRLSHCFASALASRALGDGTKQYFIASTAASTLKEFEHAWMHYVSTTPFSHFLNTSSIAPVLLALDAAHARAAASASAAANAAAPAHSPRRCNERLHVIDLNIESAYIWQFLLRQLAARPQAPPLSVRITVLDVCPRSMADASKGRRARAVEIKEQLAVQAVVVGIEEFECDVVFCWMEEMEEGLRKVRVDRRSSLRREQQQQPALQERKGVADGRSFGVNPRGYDAATSLHLEGVSPSGGCQNGDVGSRAKRVHVDRGERGQEGRTDAASGSSGGTSDCDVDVLVVAGGLRLHEFPDESRGDASSALCTFLKWIWSLQPDLVTVTEFDYCASGPFLVPRVEECFDFLAAWMHCHDIMCVNAAEGKQSSYQGSAAIRPLLSEAIAMEEEEEKEEEDEDEDEASQATSLSGFRLGLPASRLRVTLNADFEGAPTFNKQLEQSSMVIVERFLLFRPALNIVALDGDRRFIRPRASAQWAAIMERNGFSVSPLAHCFEHRMHSASHGYPGCVTVQPAKGGVSLNVCGRNELYVSLWIQ